MAATSSADAAAGRPGAPDRPLLDFVQKVRLACIARRSEAETRIGQGLEDWIQEIFDSPDLAIPQAPRNKWLDERRCQELNARCDDIRVGPFMRLNKYVLQHSRNRSEMVNEPVAAPSPSKRPRTADDASECTPRSSRLEVREAGAEELKRASVGSNKLEARLSAACLPSPCRGSDFNPSRRSATFVAPPAAEEAAKPLAEPSAEGTAATKSKASRRSATFMAPDAMEGLVESKPEVVEPVAEEKVVAKSKASRRSATFMAPPDMEGLAESKPDVEPCVDEPVVAKSKASRRSATFMAPDVSGTDACMEPQMAQDQVMQDSLCYSAPPPMQVDETEPTCVAEPVEPPTASQEDAVEQSSGICFSAPPPVATQEQPSDSMETGESPQEVVTEVTSVNATSARFSAPPLGEASSKELAEPVGSTRLSAPSPLETGPLTASGDGVQPSTVGNAETEPPAPAPRSNPWQSSLFAPPSSSSSSSRARVGLGESQSAKILPRVEPPPEPETPQDSAQEDMWKRLEAPEGTPVTVSERKKLFEGMRSTPNGIRPPSARAGSASRPAAGNSGQLTPSASAPVGSGSANVPTANSMFTPLPGSTSSVRKELFRANTPPVPGPGAVPVARPVAKAAANPTLASSSSQKQVGAAASSAGQSTAGAQSSTQAAAEQADRKPPTDTFELLSAGTRRDDFAKPKSLKAAEAAREEAKLKEERKQREKLEREQERERSRAAAVGTGSQAQAPQKKAHRRSAVMDPDGEPAMSDSAADGACAGDRVRPPVPEFRPEPEPWQLLRQVALPPKRQEDNYEISETGDSENEDADVSRDRATKHVPSWCSNYMELLTQQAELDPDTIFGSRVPACNLDEIFTDDIYRRVSKNRPARKRGSSADWRRDKLTRNEIKAYKSRMGQQKSYEDVTPISSQASLAAAAAAAAPPCASAPAPASASFF